MLKLETRYIEKISLLNGADPFLGTIPGAQITNDLPPVDAIDFAFLPRFKNKLYNYDTIQGPNSLEAYNQFICGWVKGE